MDNSTGLSKPRTPRTLLVALILAMLLTGVAGTTSCDGDMSMRGVIITFYAVSLVVVVGVIMMVSDADLAEGSETANYDCIVINNAELPMKMFEGGQELGLVEPNATKPFALGSGAHDLTWFPVDGGVGQDGFSRSFTFGEEQVYYQITIDPIT